jgi:hypothetical protein
MNNLIGNLRAEIDRLRDEVDALRHARKSNEAEINRLFAESEKYKTDALRYRAMFLRSPL